MTPEDIAAVSHASLLPHLSALGITRLADITGLDRVGVPVALAVRPMGRALAVNQGKGLTLSVAKISAILEAAEQAAAEAHRLPLFYGTAAQRRQSHRLADTALLPKRQGSPFHEHYPILWVAARGMRTGEEVLVPYELVHSDFTFPQPAGSGCFVQSTNGLAAHFKRDGAMLHGLLEVIERDQLALLERRDPSRHTIDLATVRDPQMRALLRRCEGLGLLVVALDATGDFGVPTISCRVMDREADGAAMAHAAEGSAARPTAEGAFTAALLEALQARLAFISGTRDDLHPADYEPQDTSDELHRLERLNDASRSGRTLAEIGEQLWSRLHARTESLLGQLQERVIALTGEEPLTVDFPAPVAEIAVLRVLAPGLETAPHPAHVPGPRLSAVARTAA